MTDYIIHKDTEDSLTHYGVKGAKWGVRRYQNEDGSYKPGAEGRYYQAVKNAFNTAKARRTEVSGKIGTAVGSKASGAVPKAVAKTISSKLSGGGGGAAKTDDTKPANKTRTGLDIDVKDVSKKLASKTSGSGKGSGSSSSEKKKEEKEKGTEDFKLSQLTDKIDNLFGEMSDEDWEEMELSDAEQDEMDDLITKYRKWRSGNSSKTKQTKKIDAFIEHYQAWRSNHGKKVEHSLIYKDGSWIRTDDELVHWGILGMKWGVRRYQNPDGTLTEEGKRRKSKGKDYADDYWKSHDKKKVEYMSDKELQQRINRLNNERQYKALTKTKKEKAAEDAVSFGKKFLERTVVAVAMGMAVKYSKDHMPEIIEAGKNFVEGSAWVAGNLLKKM